MRSAMGMKTSEIGREQNKKSAAIGSKRRYDRKRAEVGELVGWFVGLSSSW